MSPSAWSPHSRLAATASIITTITMIIIFLHNIYDIHIAISIYITHIFVCGDVLSEIVGAKRVAGDCLGGYFTARLGYRPSIRFIVPGESRVMSWNGCWVIVYRWSDVTLPLRSDSTS